MEKSRMFSSIRTLKNIRKYHQNGWLKFHETMFLCNSSSDFEREDVKKCFHSVSIGIKFISDDENEKMLISKTYNINFDKIKYTHLLLKNICDYNVDLDEFVKSKEFNDKYESEISWGFTFLDGIVYDVESRLIPKIQKLIEI